MLLPQHGVDLLQLLHGSSCIHLELLHQNSDWDEAPCPDPSGRGPFCQPCAALWWGHHHRRWEPLLCQPSGSAMPEGCVYRHHVEPQGGSNWWGYGGGKESSWTGTGGGVRERGMRGLWERNGGGGGCIREGREWWNVLRRTPSGRPS